MDEPVVEGDVTHRSYPKKAQIIGGLIGGCFALCLMIFFLQFFWRRYIRAHQKPQNTSAHQIDTADAQEEHHGRNLENIQTQQPREKQLDPFQSSPESNLDRQIKPLPEVPRRPPPLPKFKPAKGEPDNHEVPHFSALEAQHGRFAVRSTAQDVENPFA